jgi:hypothetical protein
MKAVKNQMLILLVATGITFLCVLFLFEKINTSSYVIIRPFLRAKESFINQPLQSDIYDSSNIDKPYILLADSLEQKNSLGMLDAKRCYEGDFQTRIEKVGSYNQMTNNYRHKDPESCSAPLTEFVSSYYKVESLK